MKFNIPKLMRRALPLSVALLLVACGGGSSSTTTANTTVPPIANAGSIQNVMMGTRVALNGSASIDPNGNTLTDNWSLNYQSAAGASSVDRTTLLSSASSVAPTFTADLAGTYLATLVVNNGTTNSSAATVTITATATGSNAAPVANAGPAQTVPIAAASAAAVTVTLDGSASTDANNDAFTYSWSLTTPASSVAALSSATAPKPTFTADLVGKYIATLIVDDGMASSVPATVTITAVASTVNVAPVANAGPAQFLTTAAASSPATTVTLAGSATDANASDTLTYSWKLTTKPATSTATLASATTLTPTFNADVAGLYIATLVANDGKLNSTPATVMISVSTVPVFPAGYITQGGLTWMPTTTADTWANANTYCDPVSRVVYGQNGWRLPTQAELNAFYSSGALAVAPAGWTLGETWSSTASTAGHHYSVDLSASGGNATATQANVTCVRDITLAATAIAPTTTAGPTVSGTTDTATTLSATINQNGTGYFMVVAGTPATAATAAEVKAGTLGVTAGSFAMTANAAATAPISGLTYSTAYTVYFVAEDVVGNLQAVQSVLVTTNALPDGYIATTGSTGPPAIAALIWMPVTTQKTWANASSDCASFSINGLTTGWRQPTQTELTNLYLNVLVDPITNQPVAPQGWTLGTTWSSNASGGTRHVTLSLSTGTAANTTSTSATPYVSCVHP